MSTINGTIRGVTLVSKAFSQTGTTTTRDRREVWLVTADFAAYTGSSDTATVTGCGAAISDHAHDGKTRTVRFGVPAFAGGDTNNQSVFFTGTAVEAATVSSDDLTGQLSLADGTEVTSTSGVTYGVGVLVGVDIS
jgi:hypothetical protein